MSNALRRAASAARFFGIGMGLRDTTALTPVASDPPGDDEPKPGPDTPPDDNNDDGKPVKKAEDDVAAAKAELDAARDRLKKAEDDGDEEEAAAAKEDCDAAEQKYEKAQAALKAARGEPDDDGDEGRDDGDDDDHEAVKRASALADGPSRTRAMLRILRRVQATQVARGQQMERRRCAAIFAHPNAAKNPDFAANLAFNTRLSRSEAVGLMASAPLAAPGRLADRMAGVTMPKSTLGTPASGKPGLQAVADHVVELYEKARGLKPVNPQK